MHFDVWSLLCGFMLGVSTYLFTAGARLIRHGVVHSPKAWSNPDLSARAQGTGLLLCGAVFTVGALVFLFVHELGGLVTAAGVLVLYLVDRHYQRQTSAPSDPSDRDPTLPDPSSTAGDSTGQDRSADR